VVVEFPSEDAAMRGVAALSGLRLWDRTLTATLLPANAATATTDTPSSSSSAPSPSPHPLHLPPFGHPIHHPFTINAVMPTGPTLQHHALSPGAAPMPSRGPASALGKRPLLADASHEAQPNGATSSSASCATPPLLSDNNSRAVVWYDLADHKSRYRRANANSELGPEYLYPPLDVDIVANIVRALAEVPQYGPLWLWPLLYCASGADRIFPCGLVGTTRFYTQTLHLMNKLHLPAPFGPQKHTTASTRARGAHHLGPQPKRRKKALTAPDDDLSTDESELESDAEVCVPSAFHHARASVYRDPDWLCPLGQYTGGHDAGADWVHLERGARLPEGPNTGPAHVEEARHDSDQAGRRCGRQWDRHHHTSHRRAFVLC
jgi:hypothetical protein